MQRLAYENDKTGAASGGHNGEYFVVCTLYYTPKESGFTFERGFDATPVTKPGLHGRKYPRDFLRSVKKEGFGRITTSVNGRYYIRYNGGDSYAFASHATGGGGVLVPRYSAAMKGGHGGLRRGATIQTSSSELQKVFGSNRWKIMDTGGGLRRWQIDCYFGEDEPLGPGKLQGRPRATTLSTLTPTHESRINVKPFTVRLRFRGDLDFFARSKTRSRSVERHLSEKIR